MRPCATAMMTSRNFSSRMARSLEAGILFRATIWRFYSLSISCEMKSHHERTQWSCISLQKHLCWCHWHAAWQTLQEGIHFISQLQ